MLSIKIIRLQLLFNVLKINLQQKIKAKTKEIAVYFLNQNK